MGVNKWTAHRNNWEEDEEGAHFLAQKTGCMSLRWKLENTQ